MREASAETGVESSGRRRAPGTSRSTADFLYDAFYGGGVAGSVLALFFLVVDSAAGQSLFTPSLLGTALFTDDAAAAATEIRIDMVAYFSVVHFLAFLIAAALISLLYSAIGSVRGRPVLMAGIAFAVLTAGFAAGALLFMPGVIETIGVGWIVLGNLIAAAALVAFLEWAHRQSSVPRTV